MGNRLGTRARSSTREEMLSPADDDRSCSSVTRGPLHSAGSVGCAACCLLGCGTAHPSSAAVPPSIITTTQHTAAHCSRCTPHHTTPQQVSGSAAAAPPDTAPVSDTCAAAGGIAGCCARLLPQEDPSMPFQISCYGARLAGNKAALADACAAAGVAPDMHALFTAMAMIETNNMCIRCACRGAG